MVTFLERRSPRAALMAEVKFLDTSVNDVLVAATGTVETSFCLVTQGDGESQRDGRTVWATGLNIKGNAYLTALEGEAAVQQGDTLRLLLVVDHQCNGVAPAVGDILATADVNSHREACKTGRFDVLWEAWHDLHWQVNAAGDYAGVVKAFTIDTVLGLELMFRDSTGAVSDLTSNNVVLLAITKNGLIGLEYTGRLFFVG